MADIHNQSSGQEGEPKERKKIMIVDDNITNLTVAKKALEASYTVVPVPSGKKALELLEKITPELILLDIEMPEMNGFQVLEKLKETPNTKDIPIIFLTAKDDHGSELEGLKKGAVDYVTKPFSIPLLLQRIALHIDLESKKKELEFYNRNLTIMVHEQTEIIYELQQAIIHTLINLVECRDGLTGGHVVRTQKYLEILFYALVENGEYQEEMAKLNKEFLFQAAQLHDIGKIATPDHILQKPGKLTPEEFAIIKQHTIVGERAIKGAMGLTRSKDFLDQAATLAISHHERWDGTGYPYGLSGTDIPISGRMMAISDVYDALVSQRPYKPSYTHEKALEIITAEAGTHFDPNLVEIFLKVANEFKKVSEQEQNKPQPIAAYTAPL